LNNLSGEEIKDIKYSALGDLGRVVVFIQLMSATHLAFWASSTKPKHWALFVATAAL
jgi:hypothetical protein